MLGEGLLPRTRQPGFESMTGLKVVYSTNCSTLTPYIYAYCVISFRLGKISGENICLLTPNIWEVVWWLVYCNRGCLNLTRAMKGLLALTVLALAIQLCPAPLILPQWRWVLHSHAAHGEFHFTDVTPKIYSWKILLNISSIGIAKTNLKI